ncbi:CDGSH iron-sulfur domain-containing protein [Actinomycetospora cinnamomea]|uniref:Iron-binding CDGSH zinc finger protein n=1 Tax=Actinomycetospora cinnamomea TaxID=663609 RepID=A0A2U1FAV1_9PSEU|nr:CDGSH iron-sulfur domain-containing protein [Actinomycetospora cinnamomea]PVZ09100.1 iron-binding CDGSH zinc finger protein [Actinomycetospora cinnamomea]
MAAPSRPTRVTLTEGGPVLVEGPVELELPDGTRVTSERPVVALCACRRTKRYPFCDTSHRRKERRAGAPKDQTPKGQAAEDPTGD